MLLRHIITLFLKSSRTFGRKIKSIRRGRFWRTTWDFVLVNVVQCLEMQEWGLTEEWQKQLCSLAASNIILPGDKERSQVFTTFSYFFVFQSRWLSIAYNTVAVITICWLLPFSLVIWMQRYVIIEHWPKYLPGHGIIKCSYFQNIKKQSHLRRKTSRMFSKVKKQSLSHHIY